MVKKKKRLGRILVEAGFITKKELNEALKIQQTSSEQRLGKILKNLGIITEQDVVEALEFQLGIPQVDLQKFFIDSEIVNLIPRHLAIKHKAVPIKKEGRTLTVAMIDPMDVMAIDDIRVNTGYKVNPVIATEEEINYAIEDNFENIEVEEDFIETEFDFEIETEEQQQEEDINELKKIVSDAPIVKLVNRIIKEGIESRASDIHIEPQEDEVWIRYRIDGILYEDMKVPKSSHPALVSRIKIMADMDIAEKRVPQDGRIQINNIKSKKVDLRISTLPTVKGEKVVIRILDKSNLMLNLDDLGFLAKHQQSFAKMINSAHGMLLITGPTGSGKTTTLYSALNSLDNKASNIVTVEDPVEYRLGGINQVQSNPKAGLNFANALRSILRQDPDIVMIGEIRDKETAEIAIHAALTGHLVLSTLHTNEAAGALSRLIDMGVEPFLVASSVIGVVAQRLVRTICPSCKNEGDNLVIDDRISKYLDIDKKSIEVYQGDGCDECNDTGYKGRTAVHEILELNDKIKKMVVNNASLADIESVAKDNGMISLETCGLNKVIEEITTIEEVMRVTKVHL